MEYILGISSDTPLFCLRHVTCLDQSGARAWWIRAVFNWVSEVIWNCFGFTLLRLAVIGLKTLAPPAKQIRCKTKTKRDLVACVFPRLALVTCIFFEFSLVRFVIGHCFGFTTIENRSINLDKLSALQKLRPKSSRVLFSYFHLAGLSSSQLSNILVWTLSLIHLLPAV